MPDLKSLEATLAKAKETYSNKPTEGNKAKYREAAQKLSDARELSRRGGSKSED